MADWYRDIESSPYNIPKDSSINELIHHPEINIILNLTVPEIHAKLTIAAMESPIRLNAKTSGRGLGHMGGTIGKLEAIEGFLSRGTFETRLSIL
ncbi:hypothetical protein [Bacillus sp. HU-1818]|uniref:hypothetical protein n=1 Tax=Bacillus sp. HU-1818 TaxID=2704469 RepID=UPI001F5CE802|nr:hypothetical protein [Bacillus sp. HU-1818]